LRRVGEAAHELLELVGVHPVALCHKPDRISREETNCSLRKGFEVPREGAKAAQDAGCGQLSLILRPK
jgi:hypothetical protein